MRVGSVLPAPTKRGGDEVLTHSLTLFRPPLLLLHPSRTGEKVSIKLIEVLWSYQDLRYFFWSSLTFSHIKVLFHFRKKFEKSMTKNIYVKQKLAACSVCVIMYKSRKTNVTF